MWCVHKRGTYISVTILQCVYIHYVHYAAAVRICFDKLTFSVLWVSTIARSISRDNVTKMGDCVGRDWPRVIFRIPRRDADVTRTTARSPSNCPSSASSDSHSAEA